MSSTLGGDPASSQHPAELPLAGLQPESWARLEGILERFEEALMSGGTPVIDEYLAEANRERYGLLLELVHIEIECRSKRGERIDVDDYLAKYPDLRRADLRLAAESTAGPIDGPMAGDRIAVASTSKRSVGQVGGMPGQWQNREIAGYQIREQIGSGGMGVVYRATQRRLNRDVAIKVIRSGYFATATDKERFLRESQVLADLKHRNIVSLYDMNQEGGIYFHVMQLVEGGNTLKTVVQDQPLDAHDAVEKMLPVVDAIEFAHQAGILHRDIKPSNILLDDENQPIVTDFGLSTRTDSESDLTTSQCLLGTPSYMAPEQIQRPNEVDRRADVYSLGATLYYLLTGRPPFLAATVVETVKQVSEDTPVEPRRLNPSIPLDLQVICMQSLRKNPADRYSSAADLAADLQRFMNKQAIVARPLSIVESLQRWLQREPFKAKVILFAACCGLLLLIASNVAAKILRDQRDQAKQAEDVANASLFASYVARAESASRQPGRRGTGLENVAKASQLMNQVEVSKEDRYQLRNHALGCLALSDVQLKATWPVEMQPTTNAAVTLYAKVEQGGRIAVRRISDNRELCSISSTSTSDVVAIDPTSQFLALLRRNTDQLELRHIQEDSVTMTCSAHGAFRFVFSSSGERLGLVGSDGTARIIDATDGKVLNHFATASPKAGLAFHPRDNRIAVSEGRRLRVVCLDQSNDSVELHSPSPVNRFDWHPSGKRLATACADGVIRLWDIENTQLRAAYRLHASQAFGVSFGENGDLLASYGWDDMVYVLDAHSGNKIMELNGILVGFGKDNQLGVLQAKDGAKSLAVWQITPSETYRAVGEKSTGRIQEIAFDSSGNQVLARAPGSIQVFNLARNETQRIKLPSCLAASWQNPNGAVAINSSGIQQLDIQPETMEILEEESVRCRAVAALSRDGRYAAFTDDRKTAIVSDRKTGARWEVTTHNRIDRMAVSPDGSLLATFARSSGLAEVWDIQNQECVQTIPGSHSYPTLNFSRTGRWIVMGSRSHYRFWKCKSWQLDHDLARSGIGIHGYIAFTADDSLAAIADSRYHVSLIELGGGEKVAELRVPKPFDVAGLDIADDGSRIVAGDREQRLHVWDLGRLRNRLKDFGLDW